jgi:outer membrane protein TolC
LVELQIGRLLAVVQLYRALGGGWQIDVAGNSP